MPILLIATTNQNKLREYAAIFAGLPFELRSLRDVGIEEDVEETGATFAENARLKAEFYAARSGLAVLADDSGLEVVALGGEPGVFSHRYAGPDASDADRNTFLLKKLEGVPFHGMIGYELFKRFIVKVDYEARRLTMTLPANWTPVDAGTAVPFVITATRLPRAVRLRASPASAAIAWHASATPGV